ncbi:MAG: carbohydrate kinase family protein [Opitutaceae bacterium]
MKLTVVGITVVDVVFPEVSRLPVWPRHTEFTTDNLVLLRKAPIVTLGGNGANAAFVAARCGAQVTLHTRIGGDEMGDLAHGWLQAAGCNVESPRAGRQTEAGALNVTAANSRHERATFFFPGAPVRMPRLKTGRNEKQAMLVCGWPHPAFSEIARVFRQVRRWNGLTALDTGPILGRPWTLAGMEPVLKELSLLLTNDHELRAIARSKTLRQAVRSVRSRFSGDLVIKRGAEGAVWLPANSSEEHMIPARRVRAVNTVGAGDGFNGALLAALCRGVAFPEALKEASAIAAGIVASRRGVLRAGSLKAQIV